MDFKLELLVDTGMLIMSEKGFRNGIAQALKQYAKATNNYVKDQYNPDDTSMSLAYLDKSNFHEWAII